MSCQTSPAHLPNMPSAAAAFGYSGRPPSAPDSAVEQLHDMFPQQARSFLLDIYEQAGSDINRAVECLETVLGTSRPQSPTRQASVEDWCAAAEGSNLAGQQSATAVRANHQHLSHDADSRMSNVAIPPSVTHADLFPPEVKTASANVLHVELHLTPCHLLAHQQKQRQVVAQRRLWWRQYGEDGSVMADSSLDQCHYSHSAKYTASSPTKLRSLAINEALGGSASQPTPTQLYDDLAHLQPQQTTIKGGNTSTQSSATAASQAPQICKASPTGPHLGKQPVEQYDFPDATWDSQSEPDLSMSKGTCPASAELSGSHAHGMQQLQESQFQLERVFENMSARVIANVLSECKGDVDAASVKCLGLLSLENGVPDWPSSDDSSSIATDSQAEAQSPRQWLPTGSEWDLDDAQALQARKPNAVLYCWLNAQLGVYTCVAFATSNTLLMLAYATTALY